MSAEMVAIIGDTYVVRKELKALGAQWHPERKAWMIHPDKAAHARKIVRHEDQCRGCFARTTELTYRYGDSAYCTRACYTAVS